jgi:phage regulator Rha-like protein
VNPKLVRGEYKIGFMIFDEEEKEYPEYLMNRDGFTKICEIKG